MDALAPYATLFAKHAYAVVFVGAVVDALGIPFPGRLLLIVAGSFSAKGFSAAGELDPIILIGLGTLGAVIGDHTWYLAGRLGGDRLLAFQCRITLGSGDCIEKARHYLSRYGALTFVIGRFAAVVRIFAAPLASSSGMPYHRFLAFDLLGAVVWSAGFVLLGYALGERVIAIVEDNGGVAVALAILALAIAALVAPLVFRLWRRRRYGSARVS